MTSSGRPFSTRSSWRYRFWQRAVVVPRNRTSSLFHSLFRKMADKKLYDILGVPRNASSNDIKKVTAHFRAPSLARPFCPVPPGPPSSSATSFFRSRTCQPRSKRAISHLEDGPSWWSGMFRRRQGRDFAPGARFDVSAERSPDSRGPCDDFASHSAVRYISGFLF